MQQIIISRDVLLNVNVSQQTLYDRIILSIVWIDL